MMLRLIADIVNKKDPQGRTFREINKAKKHKYKIDQLVELYSGARLFVAAHERDCDGSPLYTLATARNTTDRELLKGFGEESLRPIVKTIFDDDDD